MAAGAHVADSFENARKRALLRTTVVFVGTTNMSET